MFRVLFLIVFASLFAYLTHQLLLGSPGPWFVNLAVAGFVGILFATILALPLYFWGTQRKPHQAWHEVFFQWAYGAMAYLNFLFFLVVFRDLIAAALFVFHPHFESGLVYNPTTQGLLLILPMLFILAGTLVVRFGLRHKKVLVTFPDLPAELDGFRLLHIGDSLPLRFVEKLLVASQALQADAVVLTGDILDGDSQRHQPALNLLKELKSRHGTFYVPGNHEYYWHGENSLQAFRALGFEVLINESRTLQVGGSLLQISGAPDPAAHGFQMEAPNFEKMKDTFHGQSFKILLSHQPWLADQASPAGFHLQLSGHTHGGQFFPWNFLIGLFQKYSKGLYQIGSLKLYVNQGAGYWGPSIRLGTYCELAEIVLTRGEP